jgi:hypothetical protein
MAFAPEVPASIVPGASPAARRVLVAAGVANGPPVALTAGVPTGFVRFISLVLALVGAGSTLTYRVWYLHRASQRWCVDTRPAPTTGGTVTLLVAAADNPQLNGAEIIGWERVYIEVQTITAGATVDAWIEAVTF